MDIQIDFTPLYQAATQGTIPLMWFLFSKGGWLAFAYVILHGVYDMWLFNQQGKWFDTNKFIMLAIDVPKDTEQTPKAVEQLFATISGAHAMLNGKEIYLQGMFQLWFSFEIVSIDGYVQFLIRTPSQFRDLVESSIYSQYPDAEITEVEDYVHTAPDKYPNETHKIWGTEIIPAMDDVLPIKTYRHFEDMSAEEKFKDPLASLLETMSKIQQGEQVWLQLLVKPTGFSWIKRSMAAAYKLAGKKTPAKKSWFSKLVQPITDIFFLSSGESMFYFSDVAGSASKSRDKDDMPSLMLHLTPGEKSSIEAIEEKASKIGFECKIRLIYIAPTEQYSVARVISSVFGSIKQFNTLDLNALKPDPNTKTKINYFFIKSREKMRRERLMSGYKNRSGITGHNWFILNIEELASLWHFPNRYIKAPMLQRTAAKKSEAPSSLPLNLPQRNEQNLISRQLEKQLDSGSNDYISATAHPATEEEVTIPSKVENKIDTGFDVDMDNDYFEERFTKTNTEDVNQKPVQKGLPPTNLPTA